MMTFEEKELKLIFGALHYTYQYFLPDKNKSDQMTDMVAELKDLRDRIGMEIDKEYVPEAGL
jgi:hypothetical protein